MSTEQPEGVRDLLRELRATQEIIEKAQESRIDEIAVDSRETIEGVGIVNAPCRPIDWLLGIPVVIDESLPPGTLEARRGDQVVGRIENLG